MRKIILFKSHSSEYISSFAEAQCECLFVEPLQFEMVNVEELRSALKEECFEALALTSARAVRAVALAWDAGAAERWRCRDAWAVGAGTTQAAASLLELQPRGASAGDARSLAHLIAQHYPNGCKLLFPCGNLSSEDLPQLLESMNISVRTITAYKTKENDKLKEQLINLGDIGKIDGGVFFSPSGCEFVLRHFQSTASGIHEIPLFAIGETTAKRMRDLGLTVVGVAPQPQPNALAQALKQYFSHQRPDPGPD